MTARSVSIGAVFLIVSLFSVLTCAQEDVSREKLYSLFVEANELYKQGSYLEASERYQKIRASGYESGVIYYNLGNIYFKAGQLGQAILNYERAALYIPQDTDLKANISYARSLIYELASARSAYGVFFLSLKNLCGVDVLASFELALFSLLFGLILMVRFLPQFRRWSMRVLAGCIVLYIFCAFNLYTLIEDMKTSGVITKKEVGAMYAPLPSATRFFTLYEGMKVKIVEENADWIRIERSDRRKGWIPSGTVERVYTGIKGG